MLCECAFPPTQPDLTRGVAGPTSNGGDEGGAFPRGARQNERWRPRVHTGVPIASELPAARAPFWGLFVSEPNFRAFAAVKKPARNDRKSDVRSSRRSSATLQWRRWPRTSRRRTSTPRPSTFCVSSRCGAADAHRRLCGSAPSVPRSAPYAGVLEYPGSTLAAVRRTLESCSAHWSTPCHRTHVHVRT